MPEATEADDGTPAGRWKRQINAALKIEKSWRKDAEKVVQRYREEDRKASEEEGFAGSRFNILFANISVLRPSIFQNAPRADVRRRYDPKPIETQQQAIPGQPPQPDPKKQEAEQTRQAATDASNTIERALTFSIDDGDLEAEARDSVDDMLLPGRGVMRVRYAPETFDEPIKDELGQPVLDEETGEPQTTSRIIDQKVWMEHVYWADFLVAPSRRWGKRDLPPWIGFRHLMTRPELVDSFGPKGKRIGLTWKSESVENESDKGRLGEADRAEVWEIWSLKDRKIIWVAMGFAKILEEEDDPLDLEGFYPVPKPMYGLKTTDTLVPVAEMKVYADLAAELDEVQERISVLTSMVKASGLYNGSYEEVPEVMKAADGEMVPVQSWELAQSGKLEDGIFMWPIDTLIKVIAQLYIQREQIKQTIFEVVGISDILRGSSDPSETLGAQRIKTQFGTLRIDERRREVNRILRDGLRIMAEIIAEKFEPQILQKMTGIELSEEAQAILKDEGMRGFLVDVESDSTVAPDETAEQEAVTKLLTSVTAFLEGVSPLVQSGMLTGKQAVQILRFAIRPFRGARNLEETLDDAERKLEELEKQPQQDEDPEAAIRQVELKIKQLDMQIAQQTGQDDIKKSELQLQLQEMKNKHQQLKLLEQKSAPKETTTQQ